MKKTDSVSNQLRITLTILAVAIVVVAIGIAAGIIFTEKNLEKTIEGDMIVVGKIADSLVSTDIDLLKADSAAIAKLLNDVDPDVIHATMETQLLSYPKFISLSVFDRNGVINDAGKLSRPGDLQNDSFVQRAFAGESVISSTRKDADGQLVIDICQPLKGDRVLVATVDGFHFSDLLKDYKIWDSGHLFIDDADGTAIANPRKDWVENQINFLELSKTDKAYESIAATVELMARGESGVTQFSVDGESRICAYQPITASKVGWSLGVMAPRDESPVKRVRTGLLLVGVICILLSALAAVFTSRRIDRPFQKIQQQDAEIREMMSDLIKAREEAVSSAEAKSDFLANMSHEMRTPLNAIIGLSELTLDAGGLPGEAARNIERVYNSGMTLLSLVNDILDISKIESGKFELIPVDYDTPSLINDTATLNIVRIGSKPIEFILNTEETLLNRMIGDELRVKQIFNNLLSNAFKYTQEGTVEWSVASQRNGDDVWLISSIKDSGIGIREEDKDKIFGTYSQLDTARNRKIQGTGLGLAITWQLVEMMDGEITVESEYGKGTTFTVRLKQGFAGEAQIGANVVENLKSFRYTVQKRDRSSQMLRVYIPYARVLVVDDVATNLDVARGMMKPYGMKVDCVDSGPAAIELIQNGKEKYNAIFMDHMMPGMDGIEATRRIREIGTDYAKNIPIIALTANAIYGNEDMFLNSGFQAFIPKPIDIMRLDASINQWVRDRDYEREHPAQEKRDHAGKRSGSERRVIGNRRSGRDRRGAFAQLTMPARTPAAACLAPISGLDIHGGIQRFSGDEKAYLDVLKSYVNNTPSLLDKLEADGKENLPDYAIVVHGIKSSSRSIGAEDIGFKAEVLEHAAKTNDAVFVQENSDGFIAEVRTLLSEIKAALLSSGAAKAKPLMSAPDPFVLQKLREASREFDIDLVEEAMNELERYDYESQSELIEWLRGEVNVSGFKRITERLTEE